MTAILEVEEIFQWLKESRQRDGLTVAKVHDNERVADAFGDGSASKAFENIRSVAEQLNASPGVVAACNALAIGVPVQRNTTARRVTLQTEQEDIFGMTKRNLLRTEDKGLREMAVALYSQQPGAGKVAAEFTESVSEDATGSAEPTAEVTVEDLWEGLLMVARKVALLEKEVQFLHSTREVRSYLLEDKAFMEASRNLARAERQTPKDYDAIKQAMDLAVIEAKRATCVDHPVPLMGDSLRIDTPNILKPSI